MPRPAGRRPRRARRRSCRPRRRGREAVPGCLVDQGGRAREKNSPKRVVCRTRSDCRPRCHACTLPESRLARNGFWALKPSAMARRKKGEKIDGWVVLDKPSGWGSTPAVGRVRRLFDAQKAGHGGTLDPLASGICRSRSARRPRRAPYIMDARKEYRSPCASARPARRRMPRARSPRPATSGPRIRHPGRAAGLRGEIVQRPPAFSALKIDGKRAYDLARPARRSN